jgi:hypothetical protein
MGQVQQGDTEMLEGLVSVAARQYRLL